MRRIVTLAALAVPGLLCAGIGAPAAIAADDCPNAAVRAQQNATRLPNCLAYERVSPADKNGGAPTAQLQFSTDGNRLLFDSPAELDGSLSNAVGHLRATRGPEGWRTDSLNPVFAGAPPTLADSNKPVAASDDLESVVVSTAYPLAANDLGRYSPVAGASGSVDLYVREPDGSHTWVVPDPSVPDTSRLNVDVLGASPDLKRVVVETGRSFDPRVTEGNLLHRYVWTRSGTHLATILPNGDLPTALENTHGTTRRVSSDGRRVAFVDTSTLTPALYVRVNADDPATAQTRTVAVGPNGEQCTGGGADLLGMSPDGTKVLFTCGSALTPGAPTRGVYMRDLDGGPSAVRLIGDGDGAPTVYGSNDDYSMVYMSGLGSDQLSVVRDGVPEPIAPLGTTAGAGSSVPSRASASSDGQYFAFQTRRNHGLPGVDVGPEGTDQTYRYSARTGEIRCISCQQDGSATTGRGLLLSSLAYVSPDDQSNPVANNGAVTFSSESGLDPADTNGVLDAYAWLDGKPVLLSSGRGAEPSAALGTSAGGDALFFTTSDALVADDRDGGGYDIYNARVGGGFLVSDPPSACTANCQAAAAERPGLPGVGSIDAFGRGNLVEQRTSVTPRATTTLTATRSVRGTHTSVRVTVSRAGSIRVSGAGLRQATVKAKKAGTYRVTVRLSAFGIKRQKQRGRWATQLRARFAPESGAPVAARKSVTFTATKKGGR